MPTLPALPCPACGARSDLATWLDRAAAGTPGSRRIAAACPRCDAAAWLVLEPGAAAIGTRVAQGDLFRPSARAALAELAVEAGPEGMLVHLGRRRWVFPRDAAPTPPGAATRHGRPFAEARRSPAPEPGGGSDAPGSSRKAD